MFHAITTFIKIFSLMIFHFTKLLISFSFCLKMFLIDNFEDIRVIESGITLLNGAFSAAPPSTSEASILGGEFLRSPQVPTSAATAEHPSDTEAS